MLNYVLIYSKDACPWCVKARDFLRERNIVNVAELKVGKDITADDFKKIAAANDRKFTVPLIFYRNQKSPIKQTFNVLFSTDICFIHGKIYFSFSDIPFTKC